uniref:28S ribosomal protein S35, mitochondrial (inferred by orthology to a human protein) n=1 Tax=Strongyloides venezuelensis TaxID=75913 RepID=A0A0K0FY55_STRVS
MLLVNSFLNSPRSLFLFSSSLRSSACLRENATRIEERNKEEFRPCFVMPDRKLKTQLALEKATGRGEISKLIRYDIKERSSRRSPRTQEMDVNQDWSSVWPAAQSFRAHTVPLPIRMGTRPNLEKRPPFKKVGNLELVKIPNFLHLTPKAVEKHCDAIKKFCTPFPKELKQDKSLSSKVFPLTVKYSDYVHQGPSLRDPRARKVVQKVSLKSLNLSEEGKEKMMRLVGNRYDMKTDLLTLEIDRCYTRKQNRDYCAYLLTVLLSEAQKVESWEQLKSSDDDMKMKFEDFQLIE